MGKHKITFISDTHSKHNMISKDLPGGDILIHAGDFMNSGRNPMDIYQFCKWFEGLEQYDNKVFIAGNHDRLFETDPEMASEIYGAYENITYLQDEELAIYYDGPNGDMPEENIRIYGSPWQPEFYNWAFNLPRHGEEMKEKWDAIPDNTDILVTHGPPFGYLDIPGGQTTLRVGCEMLRERVEAFKPKIHVFGHIHGSRSIHHNGNTLFVNASVLDEQYRYTNKPICIEFDFETLNYEIIQI